MLDAYEERRYNYMDRCQLTIEGINMKKVILFSVLAFALGAFADDSYIYWMVANDATYEGEALDFSSGKWSAKVRAIEGTTWSKAGDGATYLDIHTAPNGGSEVGSSVGMEVANFHGDFGNTPYYVSLATAAGQNWTYFVELYNDGAIFAYSEGLPYSEAGIATFSGIGVPSKWSVASFAAVPEPNSALLLLIGCAALALRRRKQAVV